MNLGDASDLTQVRQVRDYFIACNFKKIIIILNILYCLSIIDTVVHVITVFNYFNTLHKQYYAAIKQTRHILYYYYYYNVAFFNYIRFVQRRANDVSLCSTHHSTGTRPSAKRRTGSSQQGGGL